MVVNMKLLPFGLTLSGLTLHGKHREIAKAHYELMGEKLDRRIIEIETDDPSALAIKLLDHDRKHRFITAEVFDQEMAKLIHSGVDLDIEMLKIERKYEYITEYEFDKAYAELKYKDSKSTDLQFMRLKVEKKHGNLTEKEFDKAVYSLGDKPWVDVIHSEYKEEHGTDGFSFELDWNDAFVKLLRADGYNGATDEEIVEQWFEDKSTDHYLGVLSDQLEELGENLSDANQFAAEGGRKTVKEKLEDKKTKHS